ncbi:MAG: hypothetical protein WC227_00230 [Patescibacteria group bacterium]|jgi:O-antigen ligase
MKKALNIFLAFLIILLPFQQLLSFYFDSINIDSGVSFWALHFYEPIILIIALIALVRFSILPKAKANLYRQLPILAILILGAFSIFFFSPSWGQGIEGFRFTLMPLVLLFGLSNLGDLIDIKKMTKVYLGTALAVAIWAILERFLPADYWRIIIPGVENGYGSFLVSFDMDLQRSASFLLGAIQLGSYLLPAFFICINNIFKGSAKKLSISLAIVLFLGVFLSFSRAALIGLIVSLFVFIFIKSNLRVKKIISIIGLAVVALAVALWFWPNATVSQFMTHGQSQAGHNFALQSSIDEVTHRLAEPAILIFGNGLGTAGPIAIKYGGIISESWYIQLLLEIGAIGLALWLYISYLVSTALIRAKELGLFFSLLAVSITAIFLHTFADNPALSYSLFILIGVALANVKKETDEKNSN